MKADAIGRASAMTRAWSDTCGGRSCRVKIPRFGGGFGIYEAPEPWGPWSTVFFTNAGMSDLANRAAFRRSGSAADGKTLYLVFSGDDSFSVRRVVLETSGGQ